MLLLDHLSAAETDGETTGVSIYDHTPTGAKTGLDVLCHALESFTAVKFNERITGAPSSPLTRPAYQGCNPISDIWSGFALQQTSKFIRRAVEDNDPHAREQMCLAATAAGVGFGNAGVHLCHAMSYPISSCVEKYHPESGYEHSSKPQFVPHGLSVILTAPAVFTWTASADPERHLKAAELLGANITNRKASDSGLILADTIRELLSHWAFVPNGLSAVGYDSSHLAALVKGTLPQRKVIDVAPRQPKPDDFHEMLENSMKCYFEHEKAEKAREAREKAGFLDNVRQGGGVAKSPWGAWVEYIDKKTHTSFYYNTVTRNSQREKPKDFKPDKKRVIKQVIYGMSFYH
eukprot:gene29748-36843_t